MISFSLGGRARLEPTALDHVNNYYEWLDSIHRLAEKISRFLFPLLGNYRRKQRMILRATNFMLFIASPLRMKLDEKLAVLNESRQSAGVVWIQVKDGKSGQGRKEKKEKNDNNHHSKSQSAISLSLLLVSNIIFFRVFVYRISHSIVWFYGYALVDLHDEGSPHTHILFYIERTHSFLFLFIHFVSHLLYWTM